MKKYSIRNYLDVEMDTVETSYGEDFAVAVYAARMQAPYARLKKAHYTAKLICILL